MAEQTPLSLSLSLSIDKNGNIVLMAQVLPALYLPLLSRMQRLSEAMREICLRLAVCDQRPVNTHLVLPQMFICRTGRLMPAKDSTDSTNLRPEIETFTTHLAGRWRDPWTAHVRTG